MMSISMDLTFIDARTHSTDETVSKFKHRFPNFQALISDRQARQAWRHWICSQMCTRTDTDDWIKNTF